MTIFFGLRFSRAYSMKALPNDPVPPVMRIDEPSRMDKAKPPKIAQKTYLREPTKYSPPLTVTNENTYESPTES